MPTRDPEKLLELAFSQQVQFVRLQFTDLMGVLKNVEIPIHQLRDALFHGVAFDGSSIDGYARIEESDMFLLPDASTWIVFPWQTHHGRVARLICDVYVDEGIVFAGDPRAILKKTLKHVESTGFSDVRVTMECEFFLLHLDEFGHPILEPNDRQGYFDGAPTDTGEICRREIAVTLQSMGFPVASSHHEVAPGQHEIDFSEQNILAAADNLMTFRMVAKSIARKHGLHVTFMPKPFANYEGSGWHVSLTLLQDGTNCFAGDGDFGLSVIARQYIAGLLRHAHALTAITNPLINSYKRLVPGYDAPILTGWSTTNPQAYVRVPPCSDGQTWLEVRVPDASCNPYLALSGLLQAGLMGIREQQYLGQPLDGDLTQITPLELLQRGISHLPKNLEEAISALEEDLVVQHALGEHAYSLFHRAKLQEWNDYQRAVHDWEYQRYLRET